MCDGLFLPMKDAQRQRRRKTDTWGGESQERRVERQIGGEGKQVRQSEEKKGKCKAREGDNDGSMKEKRGKYRKELESEKLWRENMFLLLAG